MEWSRHGYVLTDDPLQVDIDAVCALLADTYWAGSRSRAQIELSLRHSTCFSLRYGQVQVGLCRAISDRVACTYLMDLVVRTDHQGRGLGSWMLARILAYPEFAGSRFMLVTRDAQAFYRRFGFETHRYDCMVRGDASQ